MGEMKSAYERALERAEKLGRLSPEELAEKREAEDMAVGKALAEQYLEHGHTRILSEALAKHSGDDRHIVLGAALSRLAEAISLQDGETTERALQGMRSLRHSAAMPEIESELRSLAAEYRQAEVELREQKERESGLRGNNLLRELGISGSAVAELRLGAGEMRAEIADELSPRFEARMEQLKKRLLE